MKEALYPDIPKDEFDLRIERARAHMAERGMDAYLIFSEQNVGYFTGFRQTFESPTVVWIGALVTARGEVTIVVTHGIFNIVNKSTWVQDIRAFGGADYWNLPKDPLALVNDLVREKLPANATIGLELGYGMPPRLTVMEIDRLRALLAGFRLVDAAPPIWAQRAIKTPWERDVYRDLCRMTVHGFLAGIRFAKAGVTERDILREMQLEFVRQGAFDTPMRGQLMIRSGRDRHDMYCARPSNRVLEVGDQLMLDSGPCYQGYLADIQRHVFIGEPPKLERDLYEQSRRGLEAALAAIRPGVSASAVWQAAQSEMLKTGVNNNVHWSFFGHSIGLTNHELPFITPEDDTLLEEHMVLSLEVPAYDVPEFRVLGAFLEEIVLVTADGCEVLTSGLTREAWIAGEGS
jgi:Xaa-Pro aminopeptidase